VGFGVIVIGPLLPNIPVTYQCDNPAQFFINGPSTNMCDDNGMYVEAMAPSCERSKRYCMNSLNTE